MQRNFVCFILFLINLGVSFGDAVGVETDMEGLIGEQIWNACCEIPKELMNNFVIRRKIM